MSCFPGPINELSGISVDQFEGINFDSIIFFVSHVHSDHIVGLSNYGFQEHVMKNNLYFYASEVSVLILRKMFEYIASRFVFLPINEATHMKTKTDEDFTVTLLPAGHCPGSVMFLFEKANETILYTGDFRMTVNELKLFKGLYNKDNDLKQISKIYLDTTHMLSCYPYFPTRTESITALNNLIKEWTDKGRKHVIHLETGYYYGSEFIITEVYKRFKMPVHVNEKYYKTYKYFPKMDECITLKPDTQIHLHCGGYRKICCSSTYDIRTIKLTAMVWMNQTKDMEIVCRDYGTYRICYASHSSLTEIQAILKFLKPNSITPNVNHDKVEDQFDMTELIKQCVSSNKRTHSHSLCKSDLQCDSSNDEYEYKQFVALKRGKYKCNKSDASDIKTSTDHDDDKIDLGILL